MDKKQILAVILSVVIILVGITLQRTIFSNPSASEISKTSQTASPSENNIEPDPVPSSESMENASELSDSEERTYELIDPQLPYEALVPVGEDPSNLSASELSYTNGYISVKFDQHGGDIQSIQLLNYKDTLLDGSTGPVEMIYPTENSGIKMRFGGKTGTLVSGLFYKEASQDPNVIKFSRNYQMNSSKTESFKITKTYTFFPEDYLFKYDVSLQNSVNKLIPLSSSEGSYSISLEPELGPLSTVQAQKSDYRRFVYLQGNDRKVETLGANSVKKVEGRFNWAAVDSKYFSLFFIPGGADYTLNLSKESFKQGFYGSSLYMTRGALQSSLVTDSYWIYAGPKLADILNKYNDASNNNAGQANLNLNKIVDGDWLGWLSNILKAIMQVFYQVVGNWGVSILLLTLLVKLLLFPLTKKSMESTTRMQALSPKLKELQDKFKDNPQKLNAEMAELYKREKVNPLGGCLPILLQFPFFLAMYSLFSNHFDLRGAMFIPGWITDLSQPETLIALPVPFSFLGLSFTGLHLLPFIYLGTQFLNGIFTQTNTGTSSGQMNFMKYGVPLIFFFILYEVPSGLLVYWIFQNVLNIGQQMWTNKYVKSKASETSQVSTSSGPIKYEALKKGKKPGTKK